MQMRKKVFVGLSGGVDSAVSAALLKERGYEVTGLFAWIALPGYPCTAGEDRREALRVAAHLQIPFREIDLSKEYRERVFSHAIDSYRRGETPNPDALCNREIKFGLLYDFAMKNGAEYFATGHYARVEKVGDETRLLAGMDSEKDQSYFLWAVPEERLAHTVFPVGGMHKREVRALAKTCELPNAERKDSQGLCFLGDVSMEEALIEELHPRPGPVLNEEGVHIGTHQGAVLYTIGQRHGFEIFAQRPDEQPQYVVAKNIEENVVIVSSREKTEYAAVRSVALREGNWIGKHEKGPVEVRFRYRQKLLQATLNEKGNHIDFAEAANVPAGQSLVAYRGERCLGGGIIEISSKN